MTAPATGWAVPASRHPRSVVSSALSVEEQCHEFARYIRYAIKSANEVEGHLELGQRLKLIAQVDASKLICDVVEIRKMLYGLLKSRGSDE